MQLFTSSQMSPMNYSASASASTLSHFTTSWEVQTTNKKNSISLYNYWYPLLKICDALNSPLGFTLPFLRFIRNSTHNAFPLKARQQHINTRDLIMPHEIILMFKFPQHLSGIHNFFAEYWDVGFILQCICLLCIGHGMPKNYNSYPNFLLAPQVFSKIPLASQFM